MTNQDYEVVKQLDHGGASVVYCVSCRRGRLKGRKLALKKVNFGHARRGVSPKAFLFPDINANR